MADESRACPNCRHPCVPEDKYCSECGFLLSSAGDANSDTLIGKTLPGGYRIVEFIAEGSMGRVYRAEQSTLGRSVAVKIMNSALLAHPKMVDRFRTEAKAASMLNHPNCMRVYDFGEMPDGPPYLVMELLLGRDLELVLQDEPFLPVTRVLDLTLQVLRALEEAHEQGIVHRDLKPANVFVLPQRGGGDLVKVVDFGLAKLKSAISGSTMTGLVCGTPQYMAPEQATASETDQRTDLYACGVMLFEMFAGKPPFIDDEPSDLLRKQVYDIPPRLSETTPERVIPGIEVILDTALAKKKEDRYQSATQFGEAIQEMVAVRTGERSHSWVRTSLRSCTECGGLFSSSARFCGECGASVPRDSLPFPMPGPHSSIPAGARKGVSSNAPTVADAMIDRPSERASAPDASDIALHEASRTAWDDSRERMTPALGRKMGPDLDLLAESIGPELKSKALKREMLPREEAPSAREGRRPVDSRVEGGHADDAGRTRNARSERPSPRAPDPRAPDPRASDPRASDSRASDPARSNPRAADLRSSDPRASGPRDPARGYDSRSSAGGPDSRASSRRDPEASAATGTRRDARSDEDTSASASRDRAFDEGARGKVRDRGLPRDPSPQSHRTPSRPSPEDLAARKREEAWSTGSYEEPEATPAALMLIEARAASRLRAGDLRSAIALLRRAIALVRDDVDRGDIDDPIGAMAMFTGKLGDALMTSGQHEEALATLSESLHLTVTGSERVRLLLQMSRAARSLHRDAEVTRYLEDAEREARRLERRRSDHPHADNGDGGRDSGVSFNRDSRSSVAPARPDRNDPPAGYRSTKRSI